VFVTTDSVEAVEEFLIAFSIRSNLTSEVKLECSNVYNLSSCPTKSFVLSFIVSNAVNNLLFKVFTLSLFNSIVSSNFSILLFNCFNIQSYFILLQSV